MSAVNVYAVGCYRWGWREGQNVHSITNLCVLINALLLFLHIFQHNENGDQHRSLFHHHRRDSQLCFPLTAISFFMHTFCQDSKQRQRVTFTGQFRVWFGKYPLGSKLISGKGGGRLQ